MAVGTAKPTLRAERKYFYGVKNNETTTYCLAEYFSDITESKNANTVDVKYVNNSSTTTYTTGMTASLAYSFDFHTPNEVNSDLADICDDELIGEDAIRTIITVDCHRPSGSGNGMIARKRDYSIVPEGDGSGTDLLTYTGTATATSAIIKGVATIATPEGETDWSKAETITFTEGVATPASYFNEE